VPLGQIASIQIVDSPASVSREAVRRRTNVEVNVRGRDLALRQRGADARERPGRPAARLRRAMGRAVREPQRGDRAARRRRAARARAHLRPALHGVRELKPALLIYLNVPFAAVGGVFLLALRGMPFSISAAIGFIALFGIAVLNGVVLLTTIKKLREQGRSPLDAAREGAESRLRAVVMTATVAALGFIPMALSSSAGAEVQRPLATVVIGGLVSATFLTLFVTLPTVYATSCTYRLHYDPSSSMAGRSASAPSSSSAWRAAR
jgi:cobalt-zinc-cadmium resistance protein CzcA